MPNTAQPPKITWVAAFIFSAKAALSGVVAVLCFDFFHLQGSMWAAISAVIVTQPSLHPSVRASFVRVTANVIGACIGAIFVALFGHTLFGLAAGIIITGMICHFTHLDDALRPAYATVCILMLYPVPGNTWFNSLERVYAVVIGCLVALLVGFLFDISAQRFATRKAATTGDSE